MVVEAFKGKILIDDMALEKWHKTWNGDKQHEDGLKLQQWQGKSQIVVKYWQEHGSLLNMQNNCFWNSHYGHTCPL